MSDTPKEPACCKTCSKTQTDNKITLNKCAKCKTTQYCSWGCQTAHWKSHKEVCAKNAAEYGSKIESGNLATNSSVSMSSSATMTPKYLTIAVDKPFHRLDDCTWLHDHPEEDVFKLLIDSYRMRVEEEYKFMGSFDDDGFYGGASDSRVPYRRFLQQAKKKAGLLPSWWSIEKKTECITYGLRTNTWSSLAAAVEKSDISEEYGDPLMPVQMRIFAEQICGKLASFEIGTEMLHFIMMTGFSID